jgi:hypothetical protein
MAGFAGREGGALGEDGKIRNWIGDAIASR